MHMHKVIVLFFMYLKEHWQFEIGFSASINNLEVKFGLKFIFFSCGEVRIVM